MNKLTVCRWKQAEEFKEELAASPSSEADYKEEEDDDVDDEVEEEEVSEPPPPGGDGAQERRMPTPTVDEKPTDDVSVAVAEETKRPAPAPSTPSLIAAPSVPSAASVPSNLAILAAKAPLLALQQALLQSNPLILGIKI